jgi:choice-of-anchor B domain-containing protein
MRLFPAAIVLTVWVLASHETAAAAAAFQDSATSITGHAVPCKDGKIRNFECQNVELLAYLPKSAIGGAIGYDVWGWTDSTTGRQFVMSGAGPGTSFVDVTDPVNPKYLGVLPPPGGAESDLDPSIKVYRNHAFIGYEGSPSRGLQVFDLTQLRDVKTPLEFKETAHYAEFGNAHTIALNPETGFAYVNGSNTCGGGLHMVDVRTPTKPTFAGCYTEVKTYGLNGPGYVHDTQCVRYHGPDKHYQGREICVNSMGGVITIADVTDKQHPTTIALTSYPNVGYAHQGWFTEDQRYFFLDDELDENPKNLIYAKQLTGQAAAQQPTPTDTARQHTRTMVFDMAELGDPVVLTQYFATTFNTDHNLYINGRYMYQGNYGAGLRIVDVGDPKNPKEAGYLTQIGEAWGTYPFLKDNVVAVSTDTGLFLARLLKP